MKSCAYCGRENPDSATQCRECGTGEFAPQSPPTTTVAVNDALDSEADAQVELQRCRDAESLTEITRILDSAGIAYRLSALPPVFDLSKIGAGDDDEVIVRVPRNLYAAARAAMESQYLESELPEDHFLLTSTDEELVEIVGQSSEWSPFDVAHARRLIAQRGIDLKKVEAKTAEHMSQLQRGRAASQQLILCGWIFSILGGLIGLGIGWSLAYMKEKTPHGDYFTYDEESRAAGVKIMGLAGTIIAAAFVLRLAFLISR